MSLRRPLRTSAEAAGELTPSPERVVSAFIDQLTDTVLVLWPETLAQGRLEARVSAEPAGGPPTADQLFVLTGWNAAGRPTTLEHNLEQQWRLDKAARAVHRVWSAAVCAAGLRWTEQAVALVGADEGRALSLAAEHGQYALLRYDRSGVTVLDARSGSPATGTRPLAWTRRPFSGCPMQVEWPDASELCRDPGGPWVSRSIAASAYWRYERRTLLFALGCDVCHGGPTAGPFGDRVGGSLLHETSVASRLGGPEQLA